MDKLEWEEVATRHILQNEWIDLRESEYRFPDGRVAGPFYSYSRRDYVVVVARDASGNFICVRQFRQGIREVTTEFVAGGIERRDGKEYGKRDQDAEDALLAAKRELLEETGHESTEWTHLLTIPSNATIADNYAFVFFADNCRKVAAPRLDETEFLEVVVLPPAELEALIRSGKFQQSVHVLAYFLAREKFGPRAAR